MDEITERTTRGLGGRLGDSLKGMVTGLLMTVAAFPLLWWNEGRALTRAQSLAEGSRAVVAIQPDGVDPANEGALIHVIGEATTDETLEDEAFGVSTVALSLTREVEMYQWKENRETRTEEKLGGKQETVTTYRYEKVWSSSPISSSSFEEPAGHENPGDMPFDGRSFYARSVTLGAFDVPGDIVRRIGGREPIAITEVPASQAGAATVWSDSLYFGDTPSSPTVGDMRVRFFRVPPQTISLVAQQLGSTFGTYQTKAGGEISLLERGVASADVMFESALQANAMLTWALRAGGFLLMALGLATILKPLEVAASVIPFVGDIVGFGTGIAAFLLAAILSLTTVAVAWIAVRPLVGVPLLVGALALLVVPKLMGGKRAAEPAAPTEG